MTAPSTRRTLALVFTVMLLDVMGLSILFPVGAFLVRRHGGGASMVTLLSALYAAAQFCAAPLLGRLSDRVGRRPVLILSMVGSAAGYVLFGVGGALWVLLLSRVIDGLTGGNMSTASACIADVSRPEERAQHFSLIGMAWGLGLVLGPALGAVAGQIRLELPAFIAAGLALASAGLCWRLLPESLPPERRNRAPTRLAELNPLSAVVGAFRRPGLAVPLLALCLFNTAHSGVGGAEGLFLIDRFAAQPWQLGALMVAVGLTIAAVQALGVHRAVPRHGERRVAVAALATQALTTAATVVTPGLGLTAVAVLARSAASAFVFPTLGALTSGQVGDREQGELLGVSAALASVTSVVGPIAAGAAYDGISPGAQYWVGAGLLAAAALVALRAPARAHASPSARGEVEAAG